MMHRELPGVAASNVYLYCQAVDMRKSFDGLLAIVQTEFRRDVSDGELFIFLNRRADRIKAIWWDGDGLAIFMKRLELGTFQRLKSEDSQRYLRIDRIQLSLILSGIELSSIKRRKRFALPDPANSPLDSNSKHDSASLA
jgi:transposase